ncbi:factor-independent urate hydroxylase [Jatrophihabitans sp.]|uniref:factor-independent urate hydroxylase n=1 Tax=Jatrophihabitans sp. TaxID=1932789 RepID=UPI0030C682F7|nr:urate oxidase [Jatrophihabitans sp.]
MVQLGPNRYGKAEVRVVHVARGVALGGGAVGDLVTDRNVSSSLSGDVAGCYLTGDNANVLATDTQKNTVYAFSKKLGHVEPERLARELAAHFVGTQAPITRARVSVEQYGWTRIEDRPNSFHRTGDCVRTTTVIHDETQGVSVVSGLRDLVVLNTTNSEFHGFPRDEFTTLAETTDRMLATSVEASWRYRAEAVQADDIDWADDFAQAKAALLATFAGTYSYSLQQTLFAIGSLIIESIPDICEVRLSMPNRHHFLVDLDPFGLANDNEVYYAADRPYGLIEGTVLADDAGPEGLAWT